MSRDMRPDPTDAMACHRGRCAIAIMAKAPSAGRIKTRLLPLLNPDEAKGLGHCFLSDMTRNLAQVAAKLPVDPYIAFTPAGSEASFASAIAPGTQFVLADGHQPAPPGVEALGRCLLQACASLLEAGYDGVALLNADSPTLPASILAETVRHLLDPRDRVVLGPSIDGGYYLIGTKHPHAALFRDIAWSTAGVADATRRRAAELGLEVVELEPWYDVDDAASLGRLVRDLLGAEPSRSNAFSAPATRAFLESRAIADRLATFS